MLYNVVCLLLLLLTVSANHINSVHRSKSTEKPDILLEDPSISKSQHPPTHISEFTDPDTGLNPFLDIEEGKADIGRNVMKDETRKDAPFMDFEIVEGEASDRRWTGMDISKAPVKEPVPVWEPFEEDVKFDNEIILTTTEWSTSPTTLSWITTSSEEISQDYELNADVELEIQNELTSSILSSDTVIYGLVTLAILTTLLLLVLGSCWWRRRKLVRTSRPTTIEDEELKC